MSSPIARRPKGAATRARILAEARRVLIDEGYDGLVLRRVASAVGIQLGNLQYYFPNRESLVLEVLLAETRSDLETLRKSVAGGLDSQRSLRALMGTFVRRRRGDAGIVHATLCFLSRHNPALQRAYRDYYEAFYAELQCALEEADPGHAPRVYEIRARLLNALMDGAAMQLSVGPMKSYLDAVGKAAHAIARPQSDGLSN